MKPSEAPKPDTGAAPAPTGERPLEAAGTDPGKPDGVGAQDADPVPVSAPQPAAKPAVVAEPARPKKQMVPDRWSAERRALIRKEWCTTRDRSGLLAQLNALPGPSVTIMQVDGYAAKVMKLRREVDARGPAPSVSMEPITTNRRTIEVWSAERGIEFHGGNIAEVNAKRTQLGMRPFALERP